MTRPIADYFNIKVSSSVSHIECQDGFHLDISIYNNLASEFHLDQVLVLALSSEWNTKTRFYEDEITLVPGRNLVTLRALVRENACHYS